MCTTALNVSTGDCVETIGELRKLSPVVFCARDISPKELRAIPDENCLCQADVVGTLVFAGFKVWSNPDVVPEYLFEPVVAREP